MSLDWAARHHLSLELSGNPFFEMFSRIALSAWAIREAAVAQQGAVREPLPSIVAEMYQKVAPRPVPADPISPRLATGLTDPMELNLDDFLMTMMPMPIDFSGRQMQYDAAP